MVNPNISIIMSVYNGEAFVKSAIESILKQTYKNFEFIILDDASKDGSLNEIKKFKDTRIKLYSFNKNKGLAFRLNQGVGFAKGKYIARMDDDDISHPDRLKKQFEFMKKNPDYDLISSKCITITQNKNFLSELPFRETHYQICKYPFISFYMPHPAWFGKRSWFIKHPYLYPSSFLSEDQELLLNTYKKSKFYSISEHLLAYRLKEKIPVMKLIKINNALFLCQIKQFYKEKNVVYMFLSGIIYLLRNLITIFPFIKFYKHKNIDFKVKFNWEKLIM